MISIFKYPVPVNGLDVAIFMPFNAEILSVQVQNGHPVLWAEVDTDEPLVDTRFRWYGTGQPIEKNDAEVRNHVGTVQMGSMVFHLFEITHVHGFVHGFAQQPKGE